MSLFSSPTVPPQLACTIKDDFCIYRAQDISRIYIDLNRKLRENCLVAILCDNSIGSLLSYICTINTSRTVILIDSKITHSEFKKLLEKYKPSYLLYSASNLQATSLLELLTSAIDIPFTDEIQIVELQYHELKYHLTKLLLATSGSTGDSKYVKITRANLLSNTESICEYLNIKNSDVAITTMPMNYTYGLSIINTHICSGATLVLNNSSVLERTFWDRLSSANVTTFGGVPFTYQLLIRLGLERLSNFNIRYLTQAGGSLSSQDHHELTSFFSNCRIKFFAMYGQTEATARISYIPADNYSKKLGSIGIAVPGGKLSLTNTYFDEKLSRTVGELQYSGPNVALGYCDGIDNLDDSDVFCGKLNTGDIAYEDTDGYYYIVGRVKRIVKLYGIRLSLDYLQDQLSTIHNDIVVVGSDKHIFIYFIPSEYCSKSNIAKSLSSLVRLDSKSYSIIGISEFPRLSSGKLDYRALSGLNDA